MSAHPGTQTPTGRATPTTAAPGGDAGAKSGPARAGRKVGALRRLARAWRSSLQAKVVSVTLLICTLATLALGMFLTIEIRDGLFDTRRDVILDDAAAATQRAQDQFYASTWTKPDDIQQMLLDTATQLGSAVTGDRDVLLLRSADQPAFAVNNTVTTNYTLWLRPGVLDSVISPQLRAAVASGDDQYWQSVSLPDENPASSKQQPGIVVGSHVSVPVAGQYELYLVYSLAPEQSTLSFIERVLLVGGLIMVVVLGVITFVVTRWVVVPVRSAARTAEKLAGGELTERMPVAGTDELASLSSSFNEMAASLQFQFEQMEQLSRLQRRFVSDVSHELRTPLTTVRMAGDILYRGRREFPPELARSTELLAAQLDRFDALLSDLLEISRFDAGAAQLDAGSEDVRDIVARVVELTLPLAERKNVLLRLYLDDAPCQADLDVRRVERVIRNLVVNAIEHAEGKPVDIYAAAGDTAVAVVVRDHGVGMTAEEVAHSFDRFWRADPARARTTGGTGLGLAISQEDARLHGGWLDAWGDPGNGASFRLVLPRHAGMAIVEAPLDLVPANPDDADIDSPRRNPLDPAAIPDLDRWEGLT